MTRFLIRAVLATLCGASIAQAADAPRDAVTIGTLYAASGTFANTSTTTFAGLRLWADARNADGGVMVKAAGRKLPVKLVAYDDQSNTGTAAALYNRLITQDHVDILLSDMGSVLTSVGVPIAREHKMMFFDQTGTGANLFSADNPYMALISAQMSVPWANTLGDYLKSEGVALGIKKVALLYATNDFTTTQANTIRAALKATAGIDIVYDSGVPTDTSNFATIVTTMAGKSPDAVICLAYPNADIAFLRAVEDQGASFPMIFTIYAGIENALVQHAVGDRGILNVFTYVPPSLFENPVNFGMTLPQFHEAWEKKYAGQHMEFGFNSLSGYNSGLVLEKTLATAESFDQLELRRALFAQSGSLKTLGGTFNLRADGAQLGLANLVGQVQRQPDGAFKLVPVFPPEMAKAKAVYPRP